MNIKQTLQENILLLESTLKHLTSIEQKNKIQAQIERNHLAIESLRSPFPVNKVEITESKITKVLLEAIESAFQTQPDAFLTIQENSPKTENTDNELGMSLHQSLDKILSQPVYNRFFDLVLSLAQSEMGTKCDSTFLPLIQQLYQTKVLTEQKSFRDAWTETDNSHLETFRIS